MVLKRLLSNKFSVNQLLISEIPPKRNKLEISSLLQLYLKLIIGVIILQLARNLIIDHFS
jgi:hypothetical protein